MDPPLLARELHFNSNAHFSFENRNHLDPNPDRDNENELDMLLRDGHNAALSNTESTQAKASSRAFVGTLSNFESLGPHMPHPNRVDDEDGQNNWWAPMSFPQEQTDLSKHENGPQERRFFANIDTFRPNEANSNRENEDEHKINSKCGEDFDEDSEPHFKYPGEISFNNDMAEEHDRANYNSKAAAEEKNSYLENPQKRSDPVAAQFQASHDLFNGYYKQNVALSQGEEDPKFNSNPNPFGCFPLKEEGFKLQAFDDHDEPETPINIRERGRELEGTDFQATAFGFREVTNELSLNQEPSLPPADTPSKKLIFNSEKTAKSTSKVEKADIYSVLSSECKENNQPIQNSATGSQQQLEGARLFMSRGNLDYGKIPKPFLSLSYVRIDPSLKDKAEVTRGHNMPLRITCQSCACALNGKNDVKSETREQNSRSHEEIERILAENNALKSDIVKA